MTWDDEDPGPSNRFACLTGETDRDTIEEPAWKDFVLACTRDTPDERLSVADAVAQLAVLGAP